MKKIVLINCYFGKYPHYFELFLKSCEYNSSVKFLFFTDNDMPHFSDNIKFVKMSFGELRDRIQGYFDFDIVLDKPYKLCDYKPVYGLVFQDFLAGYDYWGYCDIDLIFGDIRSFLREDILSEYDKIYQLGHLTLFRNCEDINKLFMSDNSIDYRSTFSTNIITVFDETEGIQKIFKNEGKKIYISRDYADITKKRYRFTLSDFLVDKKNNNYSRQLFCREQGRIYRYYASEGGVVEREEFIYIHFQKRKMPRLCNPCANYFITYNGFYEFNPPVTIKDIKSNNRFLLAEEIKNYIQVFSWRLSRKVDKLLKEKRR